MNLFTDVLYNLPAREMCGNFLKRVGKSDSNEGVGYWLLEEGGEETRKSTTIKSEED